MATTQEVRDKLTAVLATVAAKDAEVDAAMAAKNLEIKSLQDRIDQGGPIQSEELDHYIGELNQIDAGVQNINNPPA